MYLWCVAAEPRTNVYPAVVGAAIGGMLFAAIATVLLLVFIIRNRRNNPRELGKTRNFHWFHQRPCVNPVCVCSTRAAWHAVWFVSICVFPPIGRYSVVWCSLWSYTPNNPCDLSYCCIQAAQPVEGKHQLPRGWDCGRIRGTNRGHWRRQDNPGSNTDFIFLIFESSCSVSDLRWRSLLQVPPWSYPGLLRLSPSHPWVPPPPPAKPLALETTTSAWTSPSLWRRRGRSDAECISVSCRVESWSATV